MTCGKKAQVFLFRSSQSGWSLICCALAEDLSAALCCTRMGPVLSVFAWREKSSGCLQSRFDEGLSWTQIREALGEFGLSQAPSHQGLLLHNKEMEVRLSRGHAGFCQLQWKLRGVCWCLLQPPRWRWICPAALCSVAVIMVGLAAVTDLIIPFL